MARLDTGELCWSLRVAEPIGDWASAIPTDQVALAVASASSPIRDLYFVFRPAVPREVVDDFADRARAAGSAGVVVRQVTFPFDDTDAS